MGFWGFGVLGFRVLGFGAWDPESHLGLQGLGLEMLGNAGVYGLGLRVSGAGLSGEVGMSSWVLRGVDGRELSVQHICYFGQVSDRLSG